MSFSNVTLYTRANVQVREDTQLEIEQRNKAVQNDPASAKVTEVAVLANPATRIAFSLEGRLAQADKPVRIFLEDDLNKLWNESKPWKVWK